jgi:hypothetical protein
MKKILLSTNIVLQIIGKIKEMTLRKVIYPKPFCRFPITRTYYYKLEVTFSIDQYFSNYFLVPFLIPFLVAFTHLSIQTLLN